jgi:hypothetical protein
MKTLSSSDKDVSVSKDKEFMRKGIYDWFKSRTDIFDVFGAAQNPSKETSWSEAASVVLQRLGSLKEVNGGFIAKLCSELLYLERVGLTQGTKILDRPPPA